VIKNSLFEFDKNIHLDGFAGDCEDLVIIGTDEAGRGPGAGGVFASAVCFSDVNDDLIKELAKLNDSKKLSKSARETLYDVIIENTINSTVCIEVEEIEKINILNSSLKAMKLACENVISREGFLTHPKNTLVLVDGNRLIKDFAPSPESVSFANSATASPSPLKGEGRNISQQYIIKGDGKSASIAAASILAKVTRDRYMQELHEKYPMYNWAQNAGYLTKEHLAAIEKYGITPHHRKSFLKKQFEKQLKLI
jgi:ribonuclease HII